jgi:hypothetical protein
LTGLKPARSRVTLDGAEIVGPTMETWFEYAAHLSDGLNSLKFSALDDQGNSSADAVYPITLDTTAPNAPTAQCVSSSTAPSKATLAGEKDPYTAILWLKRDNMEELLVGGDAKSTWTAALNVNSGTVTLIAKDIAGNTASTDVSLTCP